MNQATSRRVVAVSAMVTFSLGFLKAANEGKLPNARFLVGIGVAFTIVAVMTDLGSPMGPAFAILIMLVAILTQFQDVFDLLNGASGGALARKHPASKKSRPSNKSTPRSGVPSNPPIEIDVPSHDYPSGIYIPNSTATVTIN